MKWKLLNTLNLLWKLFFATSGFCWTQARSFSLIIWWPGGSVHSCGGLYLNLRCPFITPTAPLWIYELSFGSTTQNQTSVWNSILTTNRSMLFFRRLWRTWFLAHSQPSPILQRNVGRRTVEASCASSTLRILNFRFDPCHMGLPAATWRDGTLKLVSRRSDRMGWTMWR